MMKKARLGKRASRATVTLYAFQKEVVLRSMLAPAHGAGVSAGRMHWKRAVKPRCDTWYRKLPVKRAAYPYRDQRYKG